MKINNKDIEQQYSAIVTSFTVGPPEVNNSFFTVGMKRILVSSQINPLSLQLQLFFEDKDNMSLFIRDVSGECIIEDDGDSFIYQCYLNDKQPVAYSHVGCDMYSATYSFSAVRMKRLRKYNLLKERNIINLDSLIVSPCRYTIGIKEDLNNLVVGGYVVKNLKAGGKLILDGFEQRIVYNSSNKFSDTTLKDNVFPHLKPGINEIVIDPIAKLDVVLEVYPLWM